MINILNLTADDVPDLFGRIGVEGDPSSLEGLALKLSPILNAEVRTQVVGVIVYAGITNGAGERTAAYREAHQ